jgi:hypothetical protein
VVKALFDTNILIDYLNAVPEAHNRPNIRVSSPRIAKSRSRKTRVRQSRNSLLRRVSRWRGARLVRRTLSAAPRAVRIVCLTALVLAAFSLTNLVYHVVRKPSELLFFVGGTLDKEPIETWRRYEPLFHTYSTSTITPELLAALAQVLVGCEPPREGTPSPSIPQHIVYHFIFWIGACAPRPLQLRV